MKTWSFVGSLGAGFGWWKVFVDSQGALSIVSDYGNWGMHWSRGGIGSDTVLQFLVRAGDDYLMGKLARRDWFDLDRSKRLAREALIEARKELRRPISSKEIESADAIRSAWDALEDVGNEHEWNAWLMHQGGEVDSYEIWGCTVREFDPQVRAFFENAWPRIVEQMKATIDRGEV